MYTLSCPHCGEDIELLNAKDLSDQYDLTPNKILNRMKNAGFPNPVLDIGNNRFWTRQQIEGFRADRSRERVQSLIVDTEEALSALPEGERALFLEALLAQAKEHEAKK